MCQCIAQEDVRDSVTVAFEGEVFDHPVEFDDDEQAPRKYDDTVVPYGFHIEEDNRRLRTGIRRRPRR